LAGGAGTIPSGVGSGELNDAALARAAQEMCDRLDAIRRASENQLLALVGPLRDGLNETFNQLAALQRSGAQQQQNRSRIEDLLPGLLQQALNGDTRRRNDPFVPPPQPQQVASRPSNNEDRSRSIFDQPVPPQPQQEPQPPMYIPPLPSADPQIGNIRLQLPTATGRTELRTAMDQVAMNESRTPVAATLGPNPMVPDLIAAKVRVQGDIRATQSALTQARYRASELENVLEVAQQGARALLPERFKRLEREAKQELEAKKKQYEQLRTQLQQSGNAEQAAQMQPILQQFQAEVSAAEAKVKRITDEIELALENGDAEIKRLARTRDQLNATVTKLQEQLGVLREEETAVNQLLQNAQQLQLQMMQQQAPPLRSIYDRGGPVRAPVGGVPTRLTSQAARSTNALPGGAAGNVRRPGLGAQQ
jgi:ABC-type transporter Mla subunit MlaD